LTSLEVGVVSSDVQVETRDGRIHQEISLLSKLSFECPLPEMMDVAPKIIGESMENLWKKILEWLHCEVYSTDKLYLLGVENYKRTNLRPRLRLPYGIIYRLCRFWDY
jgi:hypothetical protein